MKMKSLFLLAIVALLVAPAGCIFSPDDDPDDGPGPGPEGLPFPSTEDILMSNFQKIYEDMDYDSFVDMMHPDYTMLLLASTQDEFPDVGATLDRAEELRMHQRMFSGQPVTDPNGNLVPAISTISFQTIERRGIWSLSQPQDVIPNAQNALYEVVFNFDRLGFSTLKVEGQIRFYVVSKDSLVGGETKTYWQMRGQQDSTENK